MDIVWITESGSIPRGVFRRKNRILEERIVSNFLVAGIVQVETIVKVAELPLPYKKLNSEPGTIFTSIGGDAYNTSIALQWLGDKVDFVSMAGTNQNYEVIATANKEIVLSTEHVLPILEETPTAVILYAADGTQQIHEDIKDIRDAVYDIDLFAREVEDSDVVVVANANFCRPLLKLAKEKKKPVAVNIRSLNERNKPYNIDFLQTADIIYMSDDDLAEDVDRFDYVRDIAREFEPEILVLGCGAQGAILYQKKDDSVIRYKTVKTNEIVNSVGAGNALFSCFLHYYYKTGDAREAIKNAQLFASYKIGYVGTSVGFMTEEQIEQWKEMIYR